MPIPAEILLVSTNYVKKFTTINGSVDSSLLEPCILLAQDRWVLPFLGTDLMTKLKTDADAGTITGVYATLLDNYVRRAICWWAIVEAIPQLTYRIDNGTMVQRTSEDTSPVSDGTMKEMMDRARSNAKSYTQNLVDYLCANSASFPEYTSNVFPDKCPRTDVNGAFNFSFSSGNTAMSRSTDHKLLRYLP